MKIIKKKKLFDKAFLDKLLYREDVESKDLSNFFDFECNEFFKGERIADRNYKIYQKRITRNERRIDFLESLINGDVVSHS